MSLTNDISVPIRHPDRFFIGGQWVALAHFLWSGPACRAWG
jgi:hypothetical protein